MSSTFVHDAILVQRQVHLVSFSVKMNLKTTTAHSLPLAVGVLVIKRFLATITRKN